MGEDGSEAGTGKRRAGEGGGAGVAAGACAVCDAQVPEHAPPLFYGGRALRFCSGACSLVFKRTPDVYAPVDPARPSALASPSPLPKTRAPSPFRVRTPPEDPAS